MENVSSHMVTLDNRKKMMVTAVTEVVSSTDKCVIAKLADSTMHVLGKNLRIGKLNLEEGLLIIEGEIDSLRYLETKTTKSFFKRIFK